MQAATVPPRLYRPAVQGLHTCCAASRKVPAGHVELHDADPAALYKPAEQFVQLAGMPPAPNFPEGQMVHAALPVVPEYPGGHVEAHDEAAPMLYVPFGERQGKQREGVCVREGSGDGGGGREGGILHTVLQLLQTALPPSANVPAAQSTHWGNPGKLAAVPAGQDAAV